MFQIVNSSLNQFSLLTLYYVVFEFCDFNINHLVMGYSQWPSEIGDQSTQTTDTGYDIRQYGASAVVHHRG